MIIDPDCFVHELPEPIASHKALPTDCLDGNALEERMDGPRARPRPAAVSARSLDQPGAELEHLEGPLELHEADAVRLPDWLLSLTRADRMAWVNPFADVACINEARDAGIALDSASATDLVARLPRVLDQ